MYIIECLQVMRQLRRTPEVSKEFNEVYRALTADAKLGHDWVDLFTTKSIFLRLVRTFIQLIITVMYLLLFFYFFHLFIHLFVYLFAYGYSFINTNLT